MRERWKPCTFEKSSATAQLRSTGRRRKTESRMKGNRIGRQQLSIWPRESESSIQGGSLGWGLVCVRRRLSQSPQRCRIVCPVRRANFVLSYLRNAPSLPFPFSHLEYCCLPRASTKLVGRLLSRTVIALSLSLSSLPWRPIRISAAWSTLPSSSCADAATGWSLRLLSITRLECYSFFEVKLLLLQFDARELDRAVVGTGGWR